MVTATRTRDDSNENKMLAWAVHLMKMHRYNVTASDPAAHARAGGSQQGRGPSRLVAESLILAGSPSRESRLRHWPRLNPFALSCQRNMPAASRRGRARAGDLPAAAVMAAAAGLSSSRTSLRRGARGGGGFGTDADARLERGRAAAARGASLAQPPHRLVRRRLLALVPSLAAALSYALFFLSSAPLLQSRRYNLRSRPFLSPR